jgi:ribonuclease-3
LELALKYTFQRGELLDEALNHASMTGSPGVGRSNERLEFLGDRVLGLAIAHILHRQFATESVGDVARRHAALVRREALSDVGQHIGLPALIRMSRGEDEAGGRTNPGVIADACEALLGAIYLDGGIEAARQVVERLWQPLIEATLRPPKDPKTELQEWAQGLGLPLPSYRVTDQSGPPHAPEFVIEVHVAGYLGVAARGRSKRLAEQAAAAAMLQGLKDERADRRAQPGVANVPEPPA